MIRHSHEVSEFWKTLPWKKFRRNLFCLQRRVFKAVQVGDYRKAKSLQKLVLKSTEREVIGYPSSIAAKCWKEDSRNRWQSLTLI